MKSSSLDTDRVRVAVAAVVWAGCACFSIVVFIRRAVGGFSAELSAAAACATTLVLGILCGALLAVWPTGLVVVRGRWQPVRAFRPGSPLLFAILAAPVILTAAAVTPLRPTPILLQLALLTAAGWLLKAFCALVDQHHGYDGRMRTGLPDGPDALPSGAGKPESEQRLVTSFSRPQQVGRTSSRPASKTALSAETMSGGSARPDQTRAGGDPPTTEETCRFSLNQCRRTTPQADSLTGTARVWLEAGQKLAIIHLPFSPSFPSAPKGTVRLTAGVGVRVKLGLVRPFGGRIELRQSEAAGPQAVQLAFSFHWPSQPTAATTAAPKPCQAAHESTQPAAHTQWHTRAG